MSDDDHTLISDLRHHRGVLKGHVTRLNNFLDRPQNRLKITDIQKRLSNIEQYFDQFEEVQTRLEFLVPHETQNREVTENSFYDIIGRVRDILNEHFNNIQINTNQHITNNSNPNDISELKLPPIKLPEFSGDYKDWASFHDAFKHLIHNNHKLTNIQRICHLKSCLKGTALKHVENLDNTDINYEIAWQLLVDRYENKRIIINDHISAILESPKIVKNSFSLRQLTDHVHQHATSLEKLGLPVKGWELVLICVVTGKLDNSLNLEWEDSLESSELPTYDKLRKFLTKKCSSYENVYNKEKLTKPQNQPTNSHTQQKFTNKPFQKNSTRQSISTSSYQNYAIAELNENTNKAQSNAYQSLSVTQIYSCQFCKQNHYIYHCSKFANLSVSEKYNEVKKLQLCTNCLRSGHNKFQCRSSGCKICNKNHNTLLHNSTQTRFTNRHSNSTSQAPILTNISVPTRSHNTSTLTSHDQNISTTPILSSPDSSVSTNSAVMHSILSNINIPIKTNKNLVLLSTAEIFIHDSKGNKHICRVLLDSGSQTNLITTNLFNTLKLDGINSNIRIKGVNQQPITISQKTEATISSRYNSFQARLNFLVLDQITENIPQFTFESSHINYPQNFDINNLADRNFNKSRQVDVLLSADIFYDLIGTRRINLGRNMPSLQETVFGWIFTGIIHFPKPSRISSNFLCNFSTVDVTNHDLNNTLMKFWQTEEIPEKRIISPDAQKCEKYFTETTTRDKNGRFIVKLPFSTRPSNLGDSLTPAIKRLELLEKRFVKFPDLKYDYTKFMREYLELNHMTYIKDVNLNDPVIQPSYFLPHHAVLKESSTTTKCRVVFDASATTDIGVSLNDTLLVGPSIQQELFYIVLNLRLFKYVITADIEKMFRQIIVHPDDRQFQQILWRHDPSDKIGIYQLNTVTYGTSSASYLSTKVLQELSFKFQNQFPRTCQILRDCFYMDDLLTSVKSIAEAIEIYRELNIILNSAGLYLRKWCSNENNILTTIESENSDKIENLIETHDKKLKTLGVSWNPTSDNLNFNIKLGIQQATNSVISKRSILATIARIFDPLGLIAPVIIKGKIFMQRLWQQQLSWDEPLPLELKEVWLGHLKQIRDIEKIQINRQVLCDDVDYVELVGFSDSSEKAYGACCYLVSKDLQGNFHSNILCAKSKVAPQKKCTLPRLELLGSLLLARLIHNVKSHLNVNISKITYFCDSTIVLCWLKIDPSKLKTFVGNRVSKIISLTDVNDWKHISSVENPADLISRGIEPNKLVGLKFWWNGPDFLVNKNMRKVDQNFEISDDLPEVKILNQSLPITSESDYDIFVKYSDFKKLTRVIAYCLRYREIAINKKCFYSSNLNANEIKLAVNRLVILAQSQSFAREIQLLKFNRDLDKSKILSLTPFLDETGVLRVGGRLKNSNLNFENKHPIILPKKHPFTKLVIRYFHEKHLHAGIQNLLSIIRLEYWPIEGKSAVKECIRSCIHCFKVNPKPTKFIMGQLPNSRTVPNKPFHKCGVDYAGPILIKHGSLRKPVIIKTYICVFICFTTRAIHLDLANDLSTESFLNVLKRFISRRGKPAEINSDNGTNFIGAHNYLLELYELINNKIHQNRVTNFLTTEGIIWKFIPARSPHLGGMWEAAVKSAKFHMRRTLGNALLRHEELYTILTQIESCLNSRPLSPISSDPQDYLPLTPGHFLIGDALVALPERDFQETLINRLTNFQRRTQLFQQFWTRWSTEYLTELQRRSKWKVQGDVVTLGDLVILMEDNQPPLKWPMARVIQLHPGLDQVTRVVSVKVPNGSVFRRSLSKICVLPCNGT